MKRCFPLLLCLGLLTFNSCEKDDVISNPTFKHLTEKWNCTDIRLPNSSTLEGSVPASITTYNEQGYHIEGDRTFALRFINPANLYENGISNRGTWEMTPDEQELWLTMADGELYKFTIIQLVRGGLALEMNSPLQPLHGFTFYFVAD